MEPNHLLSKELNYELRLRKVDPEGSVDEKRKLLRGLLSQESANRSFLEGVSNNYLFKEDAKEIKESLDDLTTKVDQFDGNRADPLFRRG